MRFWIWSNLLFLVMQRLRFDLDGIQRVVVLVLLCCLINLEIDGAAWNLQVSTAGPIGLDRLVRVMLIRPRPERTVGVHFLHLLRAPWDALYASIRSFPWLT